ncbi:PBP1A family penicillin-binding protein [Aristophania vespae]|uniref:Penicillin-binding protein 1A n=1 Tax=Aristophania vespae TaxID=2697033 RepID=A0A6P1NML3_9PROT|nr:PBP1A family penicillin-binding protein [Aristophania vespae]QHI96081.1 PBP1A family penicillin-binding protein [Aristophania vespae]
MTRNSLRPERPTSSVHKPVFRRYRTFLALVLGLISFCCVGTLLVGLGFYSHLTSDLPSVEALQHYNPPVVSRLYTSDDQLMAELAYERRIYVPITAVPDKVKRAFIAAEDQNFYNHKGIDPMAIARAALTDVFARHGKRPLGASTITQQVAKVMLLNNNNLTLTRKAREALLAMRIEEALSKERILEIYLNGIYLGAGAYGVEAAAQSYFNKSLDQLDDAEAAMLGALPKSPTKYNPFLHPDTALWRRNWVLDRMHETGVISASAAEAAKQEPLIPQKRRRSGPLPTTEWFSEEVRRQLITQYGSDQALQGGLDVHTSLDPYLQQVSTHALQNGLMAYDRRYSGWRGAIQHLDTIKDWSAQLNKLTPPRGMLTEWRLAVVLTQAPVTVGWNEYKTPKTASLRAADITWSRRAHPLRPGDVILIEPAADGSVALKQIPQVQGATVTIDAHSGRVLALVGGWSFKQSQFNRATQALRQPGSSFKPLVYLAAMEKGISPSETFKDSPISFGDWHPKNYEHNNWGPTTLHDALRESRNLVTIRVAAYLGMAAVGDLAVKAGMVDSMPPYLPAALGAVETTVLKEASAYAAIANGGHVVKPTLVDYIQSPQGNILWRREGFSLNAPEGGLPQLTDQRPVLASPQSAYQIVTMMRDVIKRGTGFRAGIGITQPIGGKTGTSQDFRDAWFAGFSPDIVTVVWAGFDTPRSLGRNETGSRVSAPIWNTIMKAALSKLPQREFPAPEGITLARYNTGRIVAVDAFKNDQTPGASVPLHGFGAGTQSLTASDTGADMIPDSEEDMEIYSNNNAAPSSSSGYDTSNSTVSHSDSSSNSDIGVGGLY